MAKNYVGLIAGIGAVAVGGFFLIRAFSGSKMDIIVQYADPGDFDAAKLIKDAIKPKQFINGFHDPLTTLKDMVVVGGQMINPVYAILENNGVFPAITEDQAGTGFIFVRTAFGHKFYGVAGWLASDTLRAAQYIKNLGSLPTQDIQV